MGGFLPRDILRESDKINIPITAAASKSSAVASGNLFEK
jgi:hypothetical protein